MPQGVAGLDASRSLSPIGSRPSQVAGCAVSGPRATNGTQPRIGGRGEAGCPPINEKPRWIRCGAPVRNWQITTPAPYRLSPGRRRRPACRGRGIPRCPGVSPSTSSSRPTGGGWEERGVGPSGGGVQGAGQPVYSAAPSGAASHTRFSAGIAGVRAGAELDAVEGDEEDDAEAPASTGARTRNPLGLARCGYAETGLSDPPRSLPATSWRHDKATLPRSCSRMGLMISN